MMFVPSDVPEAGERIREAVRAVLLDTDERVMLVRYEFPAHFDSGGTVWALPGGGLQPDEGHEEALQRELAEELGVAGVVLGPHVWDRFHRMMFGNGNFDGQRERFYVVITEPFEPEPAIGWDQLRAEYVHELRWFHAHELGDLGDRIAPAALPALLTTLKTHGAPSQPVDAGL